MAKSKKKNTNKKVLFLFVLLALIILVITFSIRIHKSKLKMSDFEKIAVYGYLENFLSLDKLYSISGKSDFNDMQITQSKIKEILDAHYANNETEIFASSVLSELPNDISIDFRSIVISDYEYSESKNAFIRKDGANSGIANIETKIQNENASKSISITNIEKISKESYKVYFNVIEKNDNNNVLESGVVTIAVNNNSFNIESCSFDK